MFIADTIYLSVTVYSPAKLSLRKHKGYVFSVYMLFLQHSDV